MSRILVEFSFSGGAGGRTSREGTGVVLATKLAVLAVISIWYFSASISISFEAKSGCSTVLLALTLHSLPPMVAVVHI
jgi:hypothetical protein